MSKNHFAQENLKIQENPKSQRKSKNQRNIFIKSFAQNVRDDFANVIKAKIAVVSLLAGLLSFSVAYTQGTPQNLTQNSKSDFKRYELKEGRDFVVLKEPLPNAQNSCLLYTSPSPRD